MDIATTVFEHILGLSFRFHLNRETGTVLRVLQRGSGSFSTILRTVLFSFFPVFLQLFIVTLYLGVEYAYYYSFIILGSVVIYCAFTFFTTEWRTKIQKKMNESDNKYNSKATDALINYETVKYFNAEIHETRRYSRSFEGYKRESIKMTASLVFLNIGQQVCITAGLTASLVIIAQKVANGDKDVGDFIMINTFIAQLYMPLNWLGSYYRMIKQALVDVESLYKMLHEQPEIEDSENPVRLEFTRGEIEFKDVSFSYGPDLPMILKTISFSVPAGKTVAIVGSSGAGKSTIVKLIYRFYEITEGSILIDGIDIRQITQNSLRNHIAIVPQDCSLFQDTISYNIGYGGVGDPDFDIEDKRNLDKVYWAADKAQLNEFIDKQKDKYDTLVGERGLRLSGGEKQRVAIARAILKRPSVLCFDEATSALDSRTEREIQKSLDEISRNRTTLIIAHRLSTIMHADLILVLMNGSIVERGKHQELLLLGGEYAKLWKVQSREDH